LISCLVGTIYLDLQGYKWVSWAECSAQEPCA
jgi:hypothetical protein